MSATVLLSVASRGKLIERVEEIAKVIAETDGITIDTRGHELNLSDEHSRILTFAHPKSVRAPSWWMLLRGHIACRRTIRRSCSEATQPPLRLVCDSRTFDSSIQRRDWNAALSSNVNSSGCSHAAKWPPFAARLK